jgi:hypothetical protein
MKPLHAEIKRLSRCPCCHSKFCAKGGRKSNNGKSSARQKAKLEIRRAEAT